MDPRHVFVTGISNGAMMSYRLACELSGKVAAIAPVEGAQDLDCHPSNSVSLIVFHGTADRLVPFDGGASPFRWARTARTPPSPSTVAFWVQQDGCSPAPQREQSEAVNIEKYSGCHDGAAVALYAIEGGHHIWPGTPFSHNDVPATNLMWSFFAAASEALVRGRAAGRDDELRERSKFRFA